jgi:stage V sporulation protein B
MVSSGIMGAAAYGIYRICFGKLGNFISTMLAICVAVIVYFVLLIKLKGIEAEEMQEMPGGTRLLGVARKLHLM